MSIIIIIIYTVGHALHLMQPRMQLCEWLPSTSIKSLGSDSSKDLSREERDNRESTESHIFFRGY